MNSTQAKRFSLLALAIILLLHAFVLADELTVSRMDTNDGLFHYFLVQGMAQAVEHGGNPLDWFVEIPFGYPIIRDYQPLAHALVVLLYFALGKSVPLLTVFVVVRYLSMVLLPLSFFLAARWMELPRWTAVAAALLAPLIVTPSLFGLEYESYIWQGYGLFAQGVAVHLLLLTLGLAFRAIRRGGPLMLAGVLLGLTFVTHFIYGYMGAATICLMALVPDRAVPRRKRIRRTVYVGAVALIVSLFQFLPLALDGPLINPNDAGDLVKNDSFGAAAVLKLLFTGQVLDYGRLPVLSLLALAGIAFIAWRFYKTRRIAAAEALALWGALFWTLVYFGRPTWGPVLWLLGIPHEFHLHRLVSGVQIFLVLAAAVGLAAVWRALAQRWHVAAAAATAAVLLFPAVWERVGHLNGSRNFRRQYLASIQAERPSLNAVVDALKRRGGYAYAGLWGSWGKMFHIGGAQFNLFLVASDIPQASWPYHRIELATEMLWRFDDMQAAHYRLFNIRSVIAPPMKSPGPPAFLTPRLTAGRFHVYDAPGNGYFEVVDAVAAVAADRHSFHDIDDRWLHSGLVARRGHLLLDFWGNAPAGLPRMAPAAALPPDLYPAPPGEISSERRSGDVFEAELNAARPAFALFRMSWHQNWKAYVDGQSVATFMLSPGFIGVPVAAGPHTIRFQYQPDAWRLALALGGLLTGGLLVAAEQTGRLRFPRTDIIEVPAAPELPQPGPPTPVRPARKRRSRR